MCKQWVMSVCIVTRLVLKVHGFNSRQGQQIYLIFSSSGPALEHTHPPLYCVPEFWGMILTADVHLAPRSGMSGAVPPLICINLLKPTGHVMHHQFNIQQLYCPHCIYVFCIYLRTNSDLCHLQHKLIDFYNRDEKCLQRGTNWVFK